MGNNIFDFMAEQSNSADVGHNLVILAFALAFVLACLIVLTYQISTPALKQSLDFMQSLILLTIVATTIMQAIGDSIARGLGILGALAIIRFRTNIRSPRNITFTFASLAAGLACGMYGFVVAIVGTVCFSLAAMLLRFSYFGKKPALVSALKFEVRSSDADLNLLIEKTLRRFCRSFEQVEMTLLNSEEDDSAVEEAGRGFRQRLAFMVILKKRTNFQELSRALSETKGIEKINLKSTKRRDET